jgi:hypothetical protein
LNDNAEEDEPGGACITHGREDEAYRGLMRTPKVKRPRGRPEEDGRIILIWFLDK